MEFREDEEWRAVVGFDRYAVSNLGRVMNCKTGRILRPGLNNHGYLNVVLARDGQGFNRKVHRLVLMAFSDYMDLSLDVNHIDGIKINNNLDNLEWATRSENIQHAFRTGLNKGGRRKKAKIIETGETFDSAKELANKIDACQGAVYDVLNCKKGHHTVKGYHVRYVD